MTRQHTVGFVARFIVVIALAGGSMAIAGPSNAVTLPQAGAKQPVGIRAPNHVSNAVFDAAPPPAEPAIAGDELWSNQFMLGTNDAVYATVLAANGDLYIGGLFTKVAGVSANHVARWNAGTNHWSALASGVNGPVVSLVISGNYLYMGGDFTSAGGAAASAIARWNLTTGAWSNMGGGMAHLISHPVVLALAVDGSGNVFAGGLFDKAGGLSSQNVAKWNGANWVSTGGVGTTEDAVDALAISGGDIYAGGTFLSPVGHVVHSSNGTTWTSLGSGTTDGPVYALAIYGSNLYVGGAFNTVDDGSPKTANNIARWSGSTWSALGAGLDAAAQAIAVDTGGHVYVAGQFTHAGGATFGDRASHVALWDGSTWSNLPWDSTTYNGVNDFAYALAVIGSDVYVGGRFTQAGGRPANYLARWNASDVKWYAPGNGVNGPVEAVVVSGSDVYVGGSFSSAGGLTANNVARWNSATNTWYTLGSGVTESNNPYLLEPIVAALAINGDNLYVGGNFKSVGGNDQANNIGRWDRVTQTWFTMDGGVSGCTGIMCAPSVRTLVPDGGGVDAGGLFVNAGSNTANNIVRWTGSAWQTFTGFTDPTTGTNGPVYAIAPDAFGGYYIGGNFTSPRTNFVFFDFDTWNSAQSPPTGSVRAIVLLGNDVYIGGEFTNAAGSGANYVAVARNGGNWQPLGASVNNSVFALSLQGQTLFAGGYFTQTGALGLNYIASWDTRSQAWANVGSGTDAIVAALATDTNFVYAGGSFLNAGGKASVGVARWGQYRLALPLVIK